MASPVTCMSLVRSHLVNVKPTTEGNHKWYTDHCAAWNTPRGAEVGLKLMIQGYAQMADFYAERWEETTLGNDGYFHEHAADMVKTLLAVLNLETGRYDCGALDKLIRRIAQVSGVELPQ